MKKQLASLLFLVTSCANALILEPMVLEMHSEQQGAIVISNPSNTSIAVDAQVLEIEFDNKEKLKEINDDLLVFPPAFLLKAGEKQHVRLIWNSNKKMQQARSFYIRFETPVLQRITDKNGSSMDVQIDYNALVHISQKEHQSRLVISKQYVENNQLILELYNGGQKYDFLSNYAIKNKKATLSNQTLTAMFGNVFFPPLRHSKLTIPLASVPKHFNSKEKVSFIKSSH